VDVAVDQDQVVDDAPQAPIAFAVVRKLAEVEEGVGEHRLDRMVEPFDRHDFFSGMTI
jgi:hypothetical protein